jgi:hypothetical protein
LVFIAAISQAQTYSEAAYYARVNTFGVFAAYSNDSSHILLGEVADRKLLLLGVSYSRRLFSNHFLNLQYDGEFMPVALEGDPTDHFTLQWLTPGAPFPDISLISIPYTACHSSSGTATAIFNGKPYMYAYSDTCGRRWTVGQALSPAGLQLNFLPHRKTQPFLDIHGGYMYSTQPVPLTNAGSFNFTLDAGVGIEIYRSQTKSIRVEYRYHHFSNNNTATVNPGVDNGLLQVTYAFGR